MRWAHNPARGRKTLPCHSQHHRQHAEDPCPAPHGHCSHLQPELSPTLGLPSSTHTRWERGALCPFSKALLCSGTLPSLVSIGGRAPDTQRNGPACLACRSNCPPAVPRPSPAGTLRSVPIPPPPDTPFFRQSIEHPQTGCRSKGQHPVAGTQRARPREGGLTVPISQRRALRPSEVQ